MRKTVLLWDSQSLTLNQSEVSRLQTVQTLYSSQLLLSKLDQNSIILGNIYDYILLTSSKINSERLSKTLGNKCNTAVINNLTGVIIYCFQINKQKIIEIQQQIVQIFQHAKMLQSSNSTIINKQKLPQQSKLLKSYIKITNQISKVISQSLGFLGHFQNYQNTSKLKDQLQLPSFQNKQKQIKFDEIQQTESSRFIIQRREDKDLTRNNQQQFCNPQLYLIKGHRIILSMFQLPFKIEKQPIQSLKKILHDQLAQFIQAKIHPQKSPATMMEKQFQRINQARNFEELAQACIYFYTLQKPALYYNLNLILKNIRYIKFKQQFQKIKTFAFLLLINYFFIYDGDHYSGSQMLFRYTNYTPQGKLNDMQVGDIVSVSTFYSVSSSQDHFLQQNKEKSQENDHKKLAKTRMTKIVIHPISQSQSFKSNLCLRSRYPAYIYSAFPKQMEILYAPFTRFKVLSILNSKCVNKPKLNSVQFSYVIHLQQLPHNIFLSKIMDINIGIDMGRSLNNQHMQQSNKPYFIQHQSKRDWELSYQLKYQKYASQFKKYIKPFYTSQNALKSLSSKSKQKIQTMVIKIKDKILRKVFNNLGIISFNLAIQNEKAENSKYLSAISYLQKALQIALRQENNQRIVATNYNNMAMVYYKKGQAQKSYEFYIKAKQVIEKLEIEKASNKMHWERSVQNEAQNKVFIANIYNNLGSISQELKNYQQAFSLYNKALSLLRKNANEQSNQEESIDQFLKANILNNIGYCKCSSGQSTQAIQIFMKAQNSFTNLYGGKQINNKSRKTHPCNENVMVKQNIARCYVDLKLFQNALIHLNNAINLEKILLGYCVFPDERNNDQNQNTSLVYEGPASGVLLNLYMAAAKLYNNNLQNYQIALIYYQNALSISTKINGKYHRTTAILYSNIGSVMQSTANTDQQLQTALSHYDSSIQCLTKPTKPQNQQILDYVIDMRSLLSETMQKLKIKI